MRSREMYPSHAGRKMEDGWSKGECESAACQKALHIRRGGETYVRGRVHIRHRSVGAHRKEDLSDTFIIRQRFTAETVRFIPGAIKLA